MPESQPAPTPGGPAVSPANGPDLRFALLVSVPLAAVPIVFLLRTVPIIEAMLRDLGGPLPAATVLLLGLAHSGTLLVVLVLVEAVTFAAVYRLAKRRGDRFMFIAPAAYVAISIVLAAIMFWPVFNIVSLVR